MASLYTGHVKQFLMLHPKSALLYLCFPALRSLYRLWRLVGTIALRCNYRTAFR